MNSPSSGTHTIDTNIEGSYCIIMKLGLINGTKERRRIDHGRRRRARGPMDHPSIHLSVREIDILLGGVKNTEVVNNLSKQQANGRTEWTHKKKK